MKVSICENPECGRSFPYYDDLGRVRTLCPKCRKENNNKSKRAWDARQTKGIKVNPVKGENAVPLLLTTEEVARRLGISRRTAQREEMSALSKIRSSAPLLKAWRSLLESGFDFGNVPELDELLEEWQGALSRWWTIHDQLRGQGLNEAADECLREIEPFQAKLNEFLSR